MTDNDTRRHTASGQPADERGEAVSAEDCTLHQTEAIGDGTHKNTPDGTNTPRHAAGESGGGAYPNPHTGKEERGEGGDWQGGQSEIGYHGSGQLGDKVVKPGGNMNSGTRKSPQIG